MRRWMTALCLLAVVSGFGCAGPGKLAEKSQSKLAEGDMWKAWQLATRALDKAPANPQARAAAAAAAASISADWQRRITALAAVDSAAAAEQVLAFVKFRTDAIPYTTVSVSEPWARTETGLRRAAAQHHYADGIAAAREKRPKRAYAQFAEAQRFVPDYRDAAQREDIAFRQATTRVAVVPLASATGDVDLGRQVAADWSGALAERFPAGDSFTRLLPAEEIERAMRVSDLGHTTRDDAIRLADRAGADRVVWGSIGPVASKTSLHFFQRSVWRLATSRDANGHAVSSWVEVPLQIVSRTRTVTVPVTYEVIATRGRATLARESRTRTLDARAVWTAYVPDGGPDTYMLVTDEMRRANPDRARQIESEWAQVVGAGTTLAQVMQARRDCAKNAPDPKAVLARYAAGAAFAMIQELPSAQELAQAAVSSSWPSVRESLARLDAVDDVDLDALSEGDAGN